jgi:hypothetical protein
MKYWGWSFPANLTSTSRPIQPQSGLNPTQSDLIRPNPTYDKKIKASAGAWRLLAGLTPGRGIRTLFDYV